MNYKIEITNNSVEDIIAKCNDSIEHYDVFETLYNEVLDVILEELWGEVQN